MAGNAIAMFTAVIVTRPTGRPNSSGAAPRTMPIARAIAVAPQGEQDGEPRCDERAEQQVTAERVRADEVLGARTGVDVRRVHDFCRRAPDDRREDRDDDDEHEDDERPDAQRASGDSAENVHPSAPSSRIVDRGSSTAREMSTNVFTSSAATP